MSNETPQQKHPKFYKDPHLWIDAIELEREIGIVTTKLTLDFLSETIKNDDLWKYKPLFKPQEGEQFIKDLESAVSAAMNEPATLLNDGDAVKLFTGGWWYVSILMENIGIVNVRSEDNDLHLFDTAAYVTTLLKLGYYL